MGRPVRLTSAAERDLADAARWYKVEAPRSIEQRFHTAVREAIRKIGERPRAFSEVRHKLRRSVLQHFPYSIFFRIDDDVILVVAIIHHARHPEEWQMRSRSGPG